MSDRLVKKAQQGDPEAFIALIEKYKKDLYRVACGYLKNDEDVADAMQETVLTAWEKLHKLQEPRWFKTWLIRILINQCTDLYRKRQETVPLAEDWDIAQPDEDQLEAESRELYSHLPDKNREVLLLHQQGYTVKEISRILERPSGTVSAQLKRGREQLKRLYFEEEPT